MLSVQPFNRNSSTLQGGLGATTLQSTYNPQRASTTPIQGSSPSLQATANPQGGIPAGTHIAQPTRTFAASAVAPDPAPAPAPAPTQASGTSGGYNYGYNTGQFSATQAQQIADLYNAAYNQKTNFLTGLMSHIGERQNLLNEQINRQVSDETQSLNTGHQQALRDLSLGRGQLDQNHDLTLRNVAQDASDTNNGLNYKIGTSSPYESSATPMVAIALAKAAERQRGDIGQQYGFQRHGFDNRETDNQNSFNNGIQSLNDFKQTSLEKVGQDVGDYQNQLRGQLADTDTSRQLSLAQLANYNGASILGNIAALQNQFNPNNINYNPVDHQAIQAHVNAMTNNLPQVQQFNVPSLGVIN